MELVGSGNSLAPGTQVREFSLQGILGEGGFGIVYRAHDLGLDRTVAVKEYMPSMLASRSAGNQIQVHPEHREAFDVGLRSFINEARLLAKFSHPALVQVYRFFEENGTAYMVMRHYKGQTFRAFLAEKHSEMDETWLTTMLTPILDGLEMLHAADCFHRDIAPDNVFLQTSGMPVLLDFGAARRIIGDMTQALTMVLKPGYAPIEQYADDGATPQGAWTDIYQLGAMLYGAITGKVPPTSVARMMQDPIRMLTPAQYPGYSAQFLYGVHQALSVRPEGRPQSIAELKSLLGIEGLTFSAFSTWPASDAMPLDVSDPPLDLSVASKKSASPKALTVSAREDFSEVTTVRLTNAYINSPDVSQETSPIFAPQASAAQNADKGLWQPQGSYPASMPPPSVVGSEQRSKFSWKLPVLLLAPIGMLAGVWIVTTRKPGLPQPSLSTVTNQTSRDAAHKEHTLNSLTPAVVPLAPSSVSSANVAVAPASAPVAAQSILSSAGTVSLPPSSPVVAPVVNARTAASPNANTSAHANTPPSVVRPRTSSTPTEEVTDSVTENRPPTIVEMGTVALKVTPWGNVRVNRSPVGSTPPLTQLNLPEGQHQIEISNSNGSTVTKLVNVTKGQTVILSHKFD
jgi:serine/threonine protein kinase